MKDEDAFRIASSLERIATGLDRLNELLQRQGQTAARNILGAREPFESSPFFWSNHFDLHIHYVGHDSGGDDASVAGDLKAKQASVIFRSNSKLNAVASVGRDRENLEAEVALERGEEFFPS